jgi:hypothetical protein
MCVWCGFPLGPTRADARSSDGPLRGPPHEREPEVVDSSTHSRARAAGTLTAADEALRLRTDSSSAPAISSSAGVLRTVELVRRDRAPKRALPRGGETTPARRGQCAERSRRGYGTIGCRNGREQGASRAARRRLRDSHQVAAALQAACPALARAAGVIDLVRNKTPRPQHVLDHAWV